MWSDDKVSAGRAVSNADSELSDTSHSAQYAGMSDRHLLFKASSVPFQEDSVSLAFAFEGGARSPVTSSQHCDEQPETSQEQHPLLWDQPRTLEPRCRDAPAAL